MSTLKLSKFTDFKMMSHFKRIRLNLIVTLSDRLWSLFLKLSSNGHILIVHSQLDITSSSGSALFHNFKVNFNFRTSGSKSIEVLFIFLPFQCYQIYSDLLFWSEQVVAAEKAFIRKIQLTQLSHLVMCENNKVLVWVGEWMCMCSSVNKYRCREVCVCVEKLNVYIHM